MLHGLDLGFWGQGERHKHVLGNRDSGGTAKKSPVAPVNLSEDRIINSKVARETKLSKPVN